MAAKKKDIASGDNRKKSKSKVSPVQKATDDDFGLDDIDDLSPIEDITEEIDLTTEESNPTIEDTSPVVVEVTPEPELEPEPEPEPEPVIAAEVPKPEQPNAIKREEEEEKKGGILWLAILIILLIVAAVYYFGFYTQEELKPVVPDEKIEEKRPEPTPEPERLVVPVEIPAELFAIEAPDGRYYAVVGSFFDEDLAEDLGEEIVQSGSSAYLLKPAGSFVYHRVGLLMESITSMKDAEANLTSYREKYGNTVWAIKY
ncbi:MAG: hypothetical protein ACJAXX_001820 [Roseivirga sp.]|jgi:hypothetical protein